MNVKLVVVQGKPEGKEIPVHTPKFLIGRGTECHLRPNSELISRHHCLFVMEGSAVTLRDLGSTNGTLVNGERIAGDVALYHEDLIQVGPLGFRIVIEVGSLSVPSRQPAGAAVAAREVVLGKAVVQSNAGSLGARDAKGGEIEEWLVGDAKLGVPDPDGGSEIVDGETELLNTKVELGDGQDTHHEFPVTPAADAPQESSADIVTLESGRKMKIGNARAKIDKTRDDTSQAAAGILRRMMDRRSHQ